MSATFLFISIGIWMINGKTYCKPNDPCWPTLTEINGLNDTLNGLLVGYDMTNGSEYMNLVSLSQNLIYFGYPSWIVNCHTPDNIQNAIIFAKEHNIQVAILSTGHSYSGRNTGNNTLQLSLSNMKKYEFDDELKAITVQTGLQWGNIYELVYNHFGPEYIIIGGSDASVGPGGYSLNGGHSPQTPRYGLSSDYTIKYNMVNADGNIVTIYNDTNNDTISDLFWALKGAGGSTFGVIVNITFQLIKMDFENNNKWTQITCAYPFYRKPFQKQQYIGYDVLSGYFNYINNGLDPTWGGYFLAAIIDGLVPYLIFFFNYWGNTEYAQQNAMPLGLLDPYNKTFDAHCSFLEYDSFWDYEQTVVPDNSSSYAYVYDTFVPSANLTNEYVHDLLSFMDDGSNPIIQDGVYRTFTGTLIGGNNNNVPYGKTAVGPGFRASYYALTYGSASINSTEAGVQSAINDGIKWEGILSKYGYGKYTNEENCYCNNCDWKKEFWGYNNYNRLLDIKQKWDPNQVFWCNHCVGSDL